MSGTPESPGEVARLVRQLQEHNDSRFDQLQERLDNVVHKDVYNVTMQNVDERLKNVVDALELERQARIEDIKHEREDREKDLTETSKRIDRQGNAVKVITVGVFIPIVLVILNMVTRSGGA